MTGIASLVDKLFAEGFIAGKYREYRIRQAWGAVAGEHLAKHARPERLANGTLFVHADNPVTVFNSLPANGALARRINDALGETLVAKIVMRVGILK
jgi:hypothetical protein